MDILPPFEFGSSKLCANCSRLQLDDEVIAEITDPGRPDFPRVVWGTDSLPGLPEMEKSSQQGCGFCGLLRNTMMSETENFIEDFRYLGVPIGKQKFTKVSFIGVYTFFEMGVSHPASIVLGVSVFFDEHPRSHNLLFAVEAHPGATASHVGVVPIPREQVLSTKSVAWIKSCLSQCDTEHAHSQVSADKRFVPTRLLDLTIDPVKLIECGADVVYSANRAPKYAALSYCWGPPEDAAHQLKTNIQSLPSRLSGIQNSEMTALLRDAIQAARSLSVLYLWIDSLCIIQDDTADWDKESIVMDRVYGKAYVTLCPLSSRSCLQGFLQRDCSRVSVPFISKLHPECSGSYTARFRRARLYDEPLNERSGLDVFKDDIQSSKWIRRGWTFQEAALSKRTVFFGATAIHFLCPSWQRTEGHQKSHKQIPQTRHEHRSFRIEARYGLVQIQNLLQVEHSLPYLYKAWNELTSVYSHRLFTNAPDILPALSGIAASFEPHVKDEYIFGLWKSYLSESLLWHCRPGSTPEDLGELLSHLECNIQRVPSWSWASRRKISFKPGFQSSGGYTVIRTDDETRSVQFLDHGDKNRNRKIQVITNACKLPSILYKNYISRVPSHRVQIGEEYLADCFLDFWPSREDSDLTKIRMILMRSEEISYMDQDEKLNEPSLMDSKAAMFEPKTFRLAYGLMIYAAEERSSYYRVGKFVSFPEEKGGLDFFKEQPVETVTII